MTTGTLLSNSSTLSGVSALMHLQHLKNTTIIACSQVIDNEVLVTIEAKNDIITLENVKDTILYSKKEDETTMETLYGIQENC